MTKYRYEFESQFSTKGECCECPLCYQEYNDQYEEWNDVCVIACGYEECPLEEVVDEAMPEYEKLKERDRAMIVTDIHIDEYYCPACGAENGCCDGKVEDKFCPRCGQRIDWTEQEEEYD